VADEEESGFNVVDKRRSAEASAPAERPAPEAPAQSSGGEEFDPANLPQLSIRDRLLMCVDILHQGAWIALGLISDPATGQVEEDLPQAKTAIDCLAFLAERLEPQLDESTQRELKNIVSNLRVNYVQRAG
jgi:hypothetical protein